MQRTDEHTPKIHTTACRAARHSRWQALPVSWWQVRGGTRIRAALYAAFVAWLMMFGLGACSSDSDGNPSDMGISSAGEGGTGAGTGGAGGTTAGMGGSGGTGTPDGSGGTSVAGSGGMLAGSGGAGGSDLDAGMAGMGANGDASVDGSGDTQEVLPPVDSVDGNGPFSTTIEQNTGPNGDGWVVRPSDLGKDGIEHPIYLWGPGGGTGPAEYEDMLERWASHGFLIYSTVSTGDGTEMIAAMDWLEEENERADSPYFEKLDTGRIAAGGHSMGSVTTFAAAPDPRLATTVHVAGGSFDGNGPSNLHAPAIYLCGENDTLATGNCERDYENTDEVPVFFTIMAGVDHISATREGQSAMIAWLRWHLAEENQRRSMFLDPDCEFCTGKWMSQSKNW